MQSIGEANIKHSSMILLHENWMDLVRDYREHAGDFAVHILFQVVSSN